MKKTIKIIGYDKSEFFYPEQTKQWVVYFELYEQYQLLAFFTDENFYIEMDNPTLKQYESQIEDAFFEIAAIDSNLPKEFITKIKKHRLCRIFI